MLATTIRPRPCKPDLYLSYDAQSGIFRWLADGLRRRKDEIAGGAHSSGYLTITFDGETHYAHRLAWWFARGVWPKKLIDHIDGNKTNNASGNLREVCKSQNAQNLKNAHVGNKAGLLGVVAQPNGLFHASICVRGKRYWLGSHKTAEEAHAAYVRKKREVHEAGTL